MTSDNRQSKTRRELREQETRRPIVTAPRIIVVRREPVKPVRKRAASSLLSFGAMTFAAALLVGVSVPANAFMTNAAESSVSQLTVLESQSVAVSDEAVTGNTTRADFTVTSYAELLRARYGNRSYSYSVGAGPVQWPFPYAVPISDGYGERVSPCRGCSSFHQATDFTPGAGAAIFSIAAGTVVHSEVSSSGLGNMVVIDHVINGVRVQSVYAHMQMNSSPLRAGDVVAVGDFIGLVGDTGASVGAHLHLEILVDDVKVDPFAWLKLNAAR